MTIANFMTSPFAVVLLPSYDAHIFMSTLFALIDPSLSVTQSTFSTSINDAVHTLEEHWDTMINTIRIGAPPNIYDLGEYRPNTEVCIYYYLSKSLQLVADSPSTFRRI
jgi:hypothetical protein